MSQRLAAYTTIHPRQGGQVFVLRHVTRNLLHWRQQQHHITLSWAPWLAFKAMQGVSTWGDKFCEQQSIKDIERQGHGGWSLVNWIADARAFTACPPALMEEAQGYRLAGAAEVQGLRRDHAQHRLWQQQEDATPAPQRCAA